ncbi:MAG: GNAT family N-acetyltransferase [Erysipelotrichaceae bacterium]|nr:GNAT family N-acetyltransferase [Erysipelotrichaceae bacterium]
MDTRNVRLVEVDTQNFDDLIGLKPSDAQRHFVADNIYSLAEAYANTAEGRYAKPFGIYDGETPVGFLMIGYDIAGEEADREKYPLLTNNYLIWRFMIDKDQQKKGYGKTAMKLALDFVRTWPCGEAEYCWLSYEPENEVAGRLYRSFGFIEAEKMPEGWDEIPAALKL